MEVWDLLCNLFQGLQSMCYASDYIYERLCYWPRVEQWWDSFRFFSIIARAGFIDCLHKALDGTWPSGSIDRLDYQPVSDGETRIIRTICCWSTDSPWSLVPPEWRVQASVLFQRYTSAMETLTMFMITWHTKFVRRTISVFSRIGDVDSHWRYMAKFKGSSKVGLECFQITFKL